MADREVDLWFAFLNEVGIIEQLSRTLFEARLPPGFLASQFAVLNHLIRVGDGRTPLEIARAFQVPKTTMTHTLAGLAGAGLVEMRPNPRDGRSKRVWITDGGRAFREAAIGALAGDVARLSTRLPAERVAALTPALAEVRRVLDADRDRDDQAE